MVIHHDSFDPLLRQPINGIVRYRAAIDTNQQTYRGILPEAARHAPIAQAIPLATAMRHETTRAQSISLKHRTQNRNRAHTINIIVTVNANLLAGIDSQQNPLNSKIHFSDLKGIGKLRQLRPEKSLNRFRLDSPLRQKTPENFRHPIRHETFPVVRGFAENPLHLMILFAHRILVC